MKFLICTLLLVFSYNLNCADAGTPGGEPLEVVASPPEEFSRGMVPLSKESSMFFLNDETRREFVAAMNRAKARRLSTVSESSVPGGEGK